jgi:hypothetical protein
MPIPANYRHSGLRRNDEIGRYAPDFPGFASGVAVFKEMRLP